MTPIVDLLTPSLLRVLALTLLHFLWQGALVAFLLAASNALLPAALAAIPLCRRLRRSRRDAGASRARPPRGWRDRGEIPLGPPRRLRSRPSRRSGAVPRPATPRPGRPSDASGPVGRLRLAGGSRRAVGSVSGRLHRDRPPEATAHTRGPGRLAGAARRELAARLRVSQPVRLLESALVEVPTALGVLRP